MIANTVFPVKDPEEVLDLTFDETDRLEGSTIVEGSPSLTIVSASGDPSPEMLSGDPVIADGLVVQRVVGGLPGTYGLRLSFDTEDGRHLVEVGYLPVRILGYVAINPDPTPAPAP